MGNRLEWIQCQLLSHFSHQRSNIRGIHSQTHSNGFKSALAPIATPNLESRLRFAVPMEKTTNTRLTPIFHLQQHCWMRSSYTWTQNVVRSMHWEDHTINRLLIRGLINYWRNLSKGTTNYKIYGHPDKPNEATCRFPYEQIPRIEHPSWCFK